MSNRLKPEVKEERYKHKKLYLSGNPYHYEPIELKSLGEVILQLFTNATRTYIEDKTGKKIKQRTGSMRSVEDTYVLAHTYLPNITYAQVERAMEALVDECYLSMSYCYDVRRRVHVLYRRKISEYLDKNNLNYYEK